MLAYFPALYPDELLYSILARLCRHMGNVDRMKFMDSLFKRRNSVTSMLFPTHLKHLVEQISPERGITINYLIEKHSLYPYYMSFEPLHVRSQIMQSINDDSHVSPQLTLGVAASRVKNPRILKFCPQCNEEMLQSYGELYWLRVHQLPGVLVCPDHGGALIDSTVDGSTGGRHGFVAATPSNCIASDKSFDFVATKNEAACFREIAISSKSLISFPRYKDELSDWTSFYRHRAMRSGLAHSLVKVKMQMIQTLIAECYGDNLPHFIQGIESMKVLQDSVAVLFRKRMSSSHPLWHILLSNFLDKQPDVFPFGVGPWICHNPLADHVGTAVINYYTVHRNHGHCVGMFLCKCGYCYTKSLPDNTGSVFTRISSYGPLLEPALRRYLLEGISLREMARRLNLDPKTVLRLAHDMGIRMP